MGDWFALCAQAGHQPRWGGGVWASPVPKRVAGVQTRSTPSSVLWCAAASRWGGCHRRVPRHPPPTATTAALLLCGCGGEWLGVGAGAAARPYFPVVGKAHPCHSGSRFGRAAHVWGLPSKVAAAVEGAGERGLRWAVCGAATERLVAVVSSLHLSAKPLLAVGVRGADVSE